MKFSELYVSRSCAISDENPTKSCHRLEEKLQQQIQRIEDEQGSFQEQQQMRDLLQGNYGPTEQFPDREGPLERAALRHSTQ